MELVCVDQAVEGGVGLVTIRNPPANALNTTLLQALFQTLEQLQQRPDVKAIVLRGADGRFSSGFDIRMLGEPSAIAAAMDQMAAVHFSLGNLLEAGPKPTVAAIEGIALGGGLEVAMACNARVCTPGASLGLPELMLGIIPGFGGTQRLPRLVGLQRGLGMMLDSKIIKGDEAAQLGLVDMLAPADDLLGAAKALATDMAEGQRPRQAALGSSSKLGSSEEAAAALAAAEQQAARQGRHAELCVESVRCGVEQGPAAGLNKEAHCFKAASASDLHKAKVQLYFVSRAAKKLPGLGALSAFVQHLILAWLYQLRGALKRLVVRT